MPHLPGFLHGVTLAVLGAVLLASAGYAPSFAKPRTVNVTLALICDIYEMKEQNGRGGFARLAAAIKAERARSRNVIVAHAGDTISPSLFSAIDRGEHVIALTNLIGPDVFVPGNHEFDFGEAIYLQRMSEATFPVLAANLRSSTGGILPGHADTKIFTFDGVRIAVIGLTADDAPKKSSPGTLRFEATVPMVKQLAPKLRAEGADLVVAVVHADRRQDLRMFYSGDLDVLLSGDDHDLAVLYNGRTAMAEAMAEGEFVVSVDLEITVDERPDRRTVKWRPRFRIIDTADVMPDPAVTERVEAYQRVLTKELDVSLGRLAAELDSRQTTVRVREAAIGNLIADAIRDQTGADVAMVNGGGIRGNKIYPAGTELTRRDVLTELPFGNKVFVVEMTGAQILKTLENAVLFANKPNGRFAHISGARVRADSRAIPGERIRSVMIGGEPLEPVRKYSVATNSFMGSGKEGYDAFLEGKTLIGDTDGPLLANVVMAYVRKKATIASRVEGRVVID